MIPRSIPLPVARLWLILPHRPRPPNHPAYHQDLIYPVATDQTLAPFTGRNHYPHSRTKFPCVVRLLVVLVCPWLRFHRCHHPSCYINRNRRLTLMQASWSLHRPRNRE